MLAGLTLIALAGLGKMGAELNPANVNSSLHFISSLGIILGNVGMILVGRAFLGKVRWISSLSLLLGGIGLVGFLSFLIFSDIGVGGLLERIGSYPIIAWSSVMGVYFILCWRNSRLE